MDIGGSNIHVWSPYVKKLQAEGSNTGEIYVAL